MSKAYKEKEHATDRDVSRRPHSNPNSNGEAKCQMSNILYITSWTVTLTAFNGTRFMRIYGPWCWDAMSTMVHV